MIYGIVVSATTLLLAIYFIFRFKTLQKTNAALNRALAETQKSIAKEVARNKQQEVTLREQLLSNEELLKAERKRIAADLHDDIIQRLVLARFRIEQLQYYILPKSAEDEVHLLHRELESIMKDIRFLIDDLIQPKFEHQTFTELVRSLVDRLSRVLHRKVEFKLQYEEDEFYLAPKIKRELYYIIQEVAQNSLNHSSGVILHISVSWEDGLLVVIEDDGQGLLQRGLGEGYGIESIKRRSAAIGANLDIRSTLPGLVVIVEFKNSE